MLGKPVFFDPTGKRKDRLKALAWVGGTLLAVTLVVFAAILMSVPTPSSVDDFNQQVGPHVSIRCAWSSTCSAAHPVAAVADPAALSSASDLAAELRKQERERDARQAQAAASHPIPALLRGTSEKPLSIGFYVNWDDNSYPALKASAAQVSIG